MTGSVRGPSTPHLQGKIAVQAHVGNCVLCGSRITYQTDYTRLPGVLGKVCIPCADQH